MKIGKKKKEIVKKETQVSSDFSRGFWAATLAAGALAGLEVWLVLTFEEDTILVYEFLEATARLCVISFILQFAIT